MTNKYSKVYDSVRDQLSKVVEDETGKLTTGNITIWKDDVTDWTSQVDPSFYKDTIWVEDYLKKWTSTINEPAPMHVHVEGKTHSVRMKQVKHMVEEFKRIQVLAEEFPAVKEAWEKLQLAVKLHRDGKSE